MSRGKSLGNSNCPRIQKLQNNMSGEATPALERQNLNFTGSPGDNSPVSMGTYPAKEHAKPSLGLQVLQA
jgi:hypothetical protein